MARNVTPAGPNALYLSCSYRTSQNTLSKSRRDQHRNITLEEKEEEREYIYFNVPSDFVPDPENQSCKWRVIHCYIGWIAEKKQATSIFLPNFFLTRIEKHQSWFSYFNIKPTRPFKAKRLTGFKFPSLSCTSRTKYSHEFLPFHPMRIELCAYLFTFWNTTEHGEAILLLCRTDLAELWWFFWPTVYTILHCACHWKTLHTVSL